jgi:hypothetical protein
MAVPASYTEKTLAQFVHVSLGRVAKALALNFGPNDAGDYAEVINDTLLAYGTENIASITGVDNIQKLRTLAKAAAWQHVVNNFAALYDFSADGGQYSRSQMFKQAKESLELAQRAALPYDTAYQVKVVAIDHKQDPYRYLTEDESGV